MRLGVHGAEHLVEVVHRLAHAHEDDVARGCVERRFEAGEQVLAPTAHPADLGTDRGERVERGVQVVGLLAGAPAAMSAWVRPADSPSPINQAPTTDAVDEHLMGETLLPRPLDPSAAPIR